MPSDKPTGCYACDLSSGHEPLVGGLLNETAHWRVEHCMGPLSLGTLIVKPKRHVLHVWQLTSDELKEMGPLIGRASAVIRQLTACEQIYVCLWSHGGFEPVHIHYVLQPVRSEDRNHFENAGPALQAEMFRNGVAPDPGLIAAFCGRAREVFQQGAGHG